MMVFANPLLLDKVFATAVQFLIDNAFDDSEVRVDFSKTAAGVACLFSNEGGGTPIEALRRTLEASDENSESNSAEKSDGATGQNLTPAQSDQLAEIEAWVVSWGGAVSVVSQPHCMSVTIDLVSGPTGSVKSTSEQSTPAATGDTGTGSEA